MRGRRDYSARVKVAIIGGGASGLVTAHLLDGAHDVTVFESAPVLGGNVRTLGRNAPRSGVPDGVFLDAGVIEFSCTDFHLFHRLMDRLGVELRDVPCATCLHRADGRRLLSPSAIRVEGFREGKVAGKLERPPTAGDLRR